MPINFNNGEWYQYNFNKLTSKPKEYYNSKNFNEYLNEWKIVLQNLDNKSNEEYYKFGKKYNSSIIKPEFYQFSQKLIESEKPYIFHFNIENIIKSTKNDALIWKFGSVKKITKEVSYDTSIKIDSRKIKKEPIILCEIPMPNYKYTVIDGNTRLNYFKNKNKKFIKYIIYNIKDNNDFLQTIDWAIYTFSKEVNKILNNTYKEEIEKDISKSIIYNFNFFK